jgi:hypothetical protein
MNTVNKRAPCALPVIAASSILAMLDGQLKAASWCEADPLRSLHYNSTNECLQLKRPQLTSKWTPKRGDNGSRTRSGSKNCKAERRLMLFARRPEAGLKHTRGTIHQAFPKGGPNPSNKPWPPLKRRVRVCNLMLLKGQVKLCQCQLRCRLCHCVECGIRTSFEGLRGDSVTRCWLLSCSYAPTGSHAREAYCHGLPCTSEVLDSQRTPAICNCMTRRKRKNQSGECRHSTDWRKAAVSEAHKQLRRLTVNSHKPHGGLASR